MKGSWAFPIIQIGNLGAFEIRNLQNFALACYSSGVPELETYLPGLGSVLKNNLSYEVSGAYVKTIINRPVICVCERLNM